MALPLLPILLLGGAGVALLALSKSGSSSGAAAPASETLTKSKTPTGTARGGYTYKDNTAASQAAAVKALGDAYKNQGGYTYHQDTSASQAATLAAQASASRDEQATRIDDKKASDYAGNPNNYQTGPAPDQGMFPSASSEDYPMTAEQQAAWAKMSLTSRQYHAAHPESDPCRCECHHWLKHAEASGRRIDLEPVGTDFSKGPDPMPFPYNCVAVRPRDASVWQDRDRYVDAGCRDGSAYAQGRTNITAAAFAAFDKKSGC